MRTSASRLLAAAGIALALATPSQLEAFPYTARRGDTLASISERFYGRVELEKVLVSANGLGDEIPLAPGMRLEIPAVSYRRVSPGDSWAKLAEGTLGDPRRAEALAMSNDSMPWVPPTVGREIVVPYPLRYAVRRGDSIASISYRFLGKRDDALVIDRYNDLRGEPVAPGDVVLVPIAELALSDEGKQAAIESLALVAGEGKGDDRDAQDRVTRELPMLESAVREGRWVDAVARGHRLLGAFALTDEQTAAVSRSLVEALVALDEWELAQAACAEWRRAAPDEELDPVLLSPKILRACMDARADRRWGAVGDEAVAAPSTSARPAPRAPR